MSKPSTVISGALIKIYLNGKLYSESQSAQWSTDFGEKPIYGVDTPFPQEIGSTRYSVSGSITGLRIKLSGGLQGNGAVRPTIEFLKSPYVSIRIQDRSTREDLIYIPNAKIANQSWQVQAKGVLRLSFQFVGLVGFEPVDRT